MLNQPPRESVWLSCVYVVLCAVAIFATVPLARAITEFLDQYVDDTIFLVLVFVVFAGAAFCVVRSLIRQSGTSISSYLWLGGVAVVFGTYTYSLRDNAVEALHFIEYGLLSLLIYRALSHRVRDNSIYLIALCLGFIVGALDEAIQWLTPHRVWDMRDILLNSVAVGLMLIAIGLGLKPAIIGPGFGVRGVVLFHRALALAIFLFGVCLLNTPPVIDLYIDKIPGMSHVRGKSSQMAEYGYLHHDPEIGSFRSRFTIEGLKKQDASQAKRAAQVLDQYPDVPLYPDFFKKYTVINDRFIHEAGVHLFRREKYLNRFLDYDGRVSQSKRYKRAVLIAWRETKILEKYYTKTLSLSWYQISPKKRALLNAAHNSETTYESPVSKSLITKVTYQQVAWGVAGSIILLLGGSVLYSRRRNDKATNLGEV
ncbi:MAG: hypothetical protein GKS01_00205 [Alphaproteobacteria bacterium]|nr:hypothetical protein [Alphaproteobacteria bacterium]